MVLDVALGWHDAPRGVLPLGVARGLMQDRRRRDGDEPTFLE
jgi:hypothetical protein